MRQTLDFLKDRPIYDYLNLVEFDKFDDDNYDPDIYPTDMDSINVYNFESDKYYPEIKHLEEFGEYANDAILFYRIYKGLFNCMLSTEWVQRSGHSEWNNASREIKALGKKGFDKDLDHISFNFKAAKGKCTATIKSPYLLELLDREIYSILKDHLERFPVSKLKSGDKSGYIHEYCKNLYPFFLYLKKHIFTDETDKYIREFIVKFLNFVNDRPSRPDEIPVTKDRITGEKLKKLFLTQENPNKKLNISGL